MREGKTVHAADSAAGKASAFLKEKVKNFC
jgi:hypothetical protein